MSDQPAATSSTPPTGRTKEVWLVEQPRSGKSRWTRVGFAFENKDGSWTVNLSAVPIGGNVLHIRDRPTLLEASVVVARPVS